MRIIGLLLRWSGSLALALLCAASTTPSAVAFQAQVIAADSHDASPLGPPVIAAEAKPRPRQRVVEPMPQAAANEPSAVEKAVATEPPPGEATVDESAPPQLLPIANASPTEPRHSAPAREEPSAGPTSMDEDVPAAEALNFNGIQPGASTEAELRRVWGEPDKRVHDDGVTICTYDVPPFRGIDIAVEHDLVQSIVIHLDAPLTRALLVEKLKLTGLRPVEVRDAEGAALGQAYPERGVLFSYAQGEAAPQVSDILIEPIDALPFVQRAASDLHGPYTANLADLRYALQLDDQLPRAHWLQAQILLTLGRVDEAEEAVQRALQIEPTHGGYRLTWAESLAARGEYERAARQANDVLAGDGTSPQVRARARLVLGDLAADGVERNYPQAVEHYTAAIELAQPLTEAADVSIRRQAEQVRVEAHLGVAYAVGWGNWKRKAAVAPKWSNQAAALAERMIAGGLAGPEIQLLVAERTLAARAAFDKEFEPAPILAEVQATIETLAGAQLDPLWQEQLAWRWGRIFRRAMQVEQGRGRTAQCLEYGQHARELLETAAAGRKSCVAAREELGRLYFNLGAVRAIDEHDHEAAVRWYDKAEPLLAPLAEAGLGDAALGDMLVSMGVSYWSVAMRQKAIDTTRLGAKLLQQAVDRGAISPAVLAVPYHNLASMHRDLGDDQQAQSFIQLAAQHDEILDGGF